MSQRPYNLNPGPAILPLEVMKQAQNELLSFKGKGLSILEISHRSKDYEAVNTGAQQDIKELFGLPPGYRVIFLGGGASLQFGMIPMNFLAGGAADYVNTGEWAKKAMKEAKRFGTVNVAGSSEDKNFSYIPPASSLKLSAGAKYVHITTNETISGTRWNYFPETGAAPLFADMSSEIGSRVIDARRFALIYAGAQKNLGPAGVTVAIIREDLLKKCPDNIITMMNYKTHVENDSLYNTPPVFAVYILGLTLQWLKKQGGLKGIEAVNNEKARLLYEIIDATGFYRGTAAKSDRSTMNVTFRLKTEELENKFLEESKKAGFIGLKGHRSVGGCRASIYNAFPLEGVKALVEFMKKFERENS
jgi:phosphoserine aminotransferase